MLIKIQKTILGLKSQNWKLHKVQMIKITDFCQNSFITGYIKPSSFFLSRRVYETYNNNILINNNSIKLRINKQEKNSLILTNPVVSEILKYEICCNKRISIETK